MRWSLSTNLQLTQRASIGAGHRWRKLGLYQVILTKPISVATQMVQDIIASSCWSASIRHLDIVHRSTPRSGEAEPASCSVWIFSSWAVIRVAVYTLVPEDPQCNCSIHFPMYIHRRKWRASWLHLSRDASVWRVNANARWRQWKMGIYPGAVLKCSWGRESLAKVIVVPVVRNSLHKGAHISDNVSSFKQLLEREQMMRKWGRDEVAAAILFGLLRAFHKTVFVFPTVQDDPRILAGTSLMWKEWIDGIWAWMAEETCRHFGAIFLSS